jgi:hypothetical protein
MTNRETGINVVREMMGDQAAQNSALPLTQTPSVPRSLPTRYQVFADNSFSINHFHFIGPRLPSARLASPRFWPAPSAHYWFLRRPTVGFVYCHDAPTVLRFVKRCLQLRLFQRRKPAHSNNRVLQRLSALHHHIRQSVHPYSVAHS